MAGGAFDAAQANDGTQERDGYRDIDATFADAPSQTLSDARADADRKLNDSGLGDAQTLDANANSIFEVQVGPIATGGGSQLDHADPAQSGSIAEALSKCRPGDVVRLAEPQPAYYSIGSTLVVPEGCTLTSAHMAPDTRSWIRARSALEEGTMVELLDCVVVFNDSLTCETPRPSEHPAPCSTLRENQGGWRAG